MSATSPMTADLLADPRTLLSPAERVSLRKLDKFNGALKVRGGYMCGGTWHRAKTFARFVTLGLAREDFVAGGNAFLRLTPAGLQAVAQLNSRTPSAKSPPEPLSPAQPRRYWLDD